MRWTVGIPARSTSRATQRVAWVKAQRAEDGSLTQQVPTRRGDVWFLRWWTERWGPSPQRLLGSHAMTALAEIEVRAAAG